MTQISISTHKITLCPCRNQDVQNLTRLGHLSYRRVHGKT